MQYKAKIVIWGAIILLAMHMNNVSFASDDTMIKDMVYSILNSYAELELTDYQLLDIQYTGYNSSAQTTTYNVVYDNIQNVNFYITMNSGEEIISIEYIEQFVQRISLTKVLPITKEEALEVAEAYWNEFLSTKAENALYKQYLAHFNMSGLSLDDFEFMIKISFSYADTTTGTWGISVIPTIANQQIAVLNNAQYPLIRWQTIYIDGQTGDIIPINNGMADYNFCYADNYISSEDINQMSFALHNPDSDQASFSSIQVYVENGWPLEYWISDMSSDEIAWVACSRYIIHYYPNEEVFGRFARMLSSVYQYLFWHESVLQYGIEHQPEIYATVIQLYESFKNDIVVR